MKKRRLVFSDEALCQSADAGLVPICFAWDGSQFYSALDRKPKCGAPITSMVASRAIRVLSNFLRTSGEIGRTFSGMATA